MENLEVPPIIPRKKADVCGRRRPENQLGKLDRGVMSRAVLRADGRTAEHLAGWVFLLSDLKKKRLIKINTFLIQSRNATEKLSSTRIACC